MRKSYSLGKNVSSPLSGKGRWWLSVLCSSLDVLLNICFYLCMLLVAYVLIQVFVVTSFRIPSDSMLPAIMPGDCVWVDKCSGGARLFNLWAAIDGQEVDVKRVPGWRDFRRGDVLVFNFPYQEGRWDSIAMDVRKYFVKRCIAVPGDTLEIRGGYYHIRGVTDRLGNVVAQREIALLPDSGSGSDVVMECYPWDRRLGWTIKEFGPLVVPRKGMMMTMDGLNGLLYGRLVEWEQKRELQTDSRGDVYLGDSLIRGYVFRENYYFVGGDNALNSQDSRYWGLLPEPFIVGRAWRIWKSVDEDGRIRWERVLRKIE